MARSAMTRFAIVADDLSSATDCGAQVVRSGLSVVVPLEGYTLPEHVPTADVISVDTDSRSLSADRAYGKVRTAVQQLVAAGWTDFYKSMDSTLRGNLGAEIEAVIDVVQPDCVIIAPAFPKYGRTTIDGVQYLQGRPLHETEFGTDPTAPVRDADITRRVAEACKRKTERLSLDQVRAGISEIRAEIHQMVGRGTELVIVDIAEQDDLRRICNGLSESGLRIVWVGSTGLAEYVPLAFGPASGANKFRLKHILDTRPALALVGSASHITREQLHFAQIKNGLNLVFLDSAPLILNGRSELEDAGTSLRSALDLGQDVALVVRSSREEIAATQRLGEKLKLSASQVGMQIVDGLAKLASRLVREDRISGVLATGGDTANALCNALGGQALEILDEVESGIPIMRLRGDQSLPLVTKAGGFGSQAAIADALVKVKQYA